MEIEFKLFHCRFCSEEKQYHDLLDLSKDEEIMEEMIQASINLKIDYLNLEDRFLPKTVCECCYTSFIKAHEFFTRLRHSQEVLKSKYSLNYVEFKVENEIVEDCPVGQLSPKCESPKPLEMDIDTHCPIQMPICDKREITIEFKEESVNNIEVISESPITESTVVESPQKCIKDRDIVNDDDVIKSYDDNDNESSSEYNNPDNKLVMINKKTSSQKQEKTHVKCDMLDVFSNQPSFHNEEIESSKSESSDLDSDTSLSNVKTISDKSWARYNWFCCHCTEKFKSMVELRTHSKMVHDICFGYSCADCDYLLTNTYNSFVEHVRQHRSGLR